MLNAGMDIREANAEDTEEACQVLRRSIIELCAADHRNDPTLLTAWLSNKTPANVAAWMRRDRRVLSRRGRTRRDCGGRRRYGRRRNPPQLCFARSAVSRREPGFTGRIGGPRPGTRRDTMHADQHGNDAALLSRARLRRDRRLGQKIRDGVRLSHVQGFGAVVGLAAPGDGGVGPDRHGPFLSERRARALSNQRDRPARPDDCGRRGRRLGRPGRLRRPEPPYLAAVFGLARNDRTRSRPGSPAAAVSAPSSKAGSSPPRCGRVTETR